MPPPLTRLHRLRADARVGLSFAAAALTDRYRPLMANLVVTRRCNLSCAYCTEYDDVSPPVPLATLRERLDHLARLRVVVVALTGGESLLHPDLAEVVRLARARGLTPAVNTNGFLLTPEWIDALNEAGLYSLQISVDSVRPNDTTVKSLKTLLPKLQLLAGRARFRVRVNTVLGAADPGEALEVVRAVMALGLEAKCSLLRSHDGRLADLDERTRAVYAEIARLEGRQPGLFDESFQGAMLRDGRVDWKCRAGARFFHVDEDGQVDLCAPKQGSPGKPLAEYGEADLRRAFDAPKPCAAQCPVAYAHQLSRVDALRAQAGAPYPIENHRASAFRLPVVEP
jgi:MoaA/NifB/PqqE/SkfB family radical SAM enzyme